MDIKYSDDLKENGFILIKNFFNDDEVLQIKKFKKDLENLPEEIGKWMIYYENINDTRIKSRTENFINYNKDIEQFIYTKIKPFLNDICMKNMVLFKDKINWKYPNGDGFKAHQDHPFWQLHFDISRFFNVVLFADNSTIENGCLEIVRNKNNIGVINNNGIIPQNIENKLKWEFVEANTCDLLIFDSYTPHRSGPNNSNNSRSIFYFTFNQCEEGNYYYENINYKRKYFPPPNERNDDNKSINIFNEIIYFKNLLKKK